MAQSETDEAGREAPAHHAPGGGFRNPWPTAEGMTQGSLLKWWWQRLRDGIPPDPEPEEIPHDRPRPARPTAPLGELRATWIGHATFLLQVGGVNLLTDPVFSDRASPVPWAGPRRFLPPGLPLDELPPIDAVLLSHGHYDHLDAPSVRALHERFGDALRWFTPLGYREWFQGLGVENLVELDWGGHADLPGPAGHLRLHCLPAQHWTSRTPWDRFERLWASWAVHSPDAFRLYFGGDSGWFPGYPQIGERVGPFDLLLLPVGAYAPRWFMRPSHMNPEEAVRAYRELGGQGTLAAMHWGTFRLTDEAPLQPPARTRAAWEHAALPLERLWVPAVGQTHVLRGQPAA